MKYTELRIWVFIGILAGAWSNALSEPRQKLILSSMTGKAHSKLTQHVYDAFNQLNDRFEVELVVLPAARATAEADNEHVDGAALRAKALGDPKYSKNLLQVPTPLVTGTLRLVIPGEKPEIKGWKDELKGLKIGVRRANPAFEGLIPEASRVELTEDIQGLKMLHAGRVDAVAILEAAYFSIIIENPEVGRGLKLTNSIPFQLFMFVHQKLKPLIPALDAEIHKAAATGRLQKAWDSDIDKLRVQAEAGAKDLAERSPSR